MSGAAFTYAELLEGIAQRFETYAGDQIGSIRWQSSKKDRDACKLRAEIWNSAAEDIREIARKLGEGA